MFNNWYEFEFNGETYSYELDGYKPLGVENVRTGEYIGKPTPEHDAIYEAACQHATEIMIERSNWRRKL
jgi:hypothetical protein